MKYVRTKSGIYETEKYCEIRKISKIYDDTFYTKDIKEGDSIINVVLDKRIEASYEKIIKEADTIIDLCDGALVEEKGSPNHWFFMGVEEFKLTPLDNLMIKSFDFKAFIKNDKGLIYVAKLNKEGVLELI